MKWAQMPTDFGWYFFTYKKEDYDLAQPVLVERHQIGDNPPFFSTRTGVIRPEHGGWWYGPIKIPRIENECHDPASSQ